MQNVRDDIFRKPKGCKKQSRYRQGAGIYVYPIEEFGKLLLLKKATAIGGMLQPKGKSSKASDRQASG